MKKVSLLPPGQSVRLAFQLHTVIDRNLTETIKRNARYQLYAN